MVNIGDLITQIILYTNVALNAGSTIILRGLLLMNIIDLLKFIEIAYPPHTISMFKNKVKPAPYFI